MKENYQSQKRLGFSRESMIFTILMLASIVIVVYVKVTSTYETREVFLPIIKLEEDVNQNYALDYGTGFPAGTHNHTNYKVYVEYNENEESIEVSKGIYEKLEGEKMVAVKILTVTDKWGLSNKEILSIGED